MTQTLCGHRVEALSRLLLRDPVQAVNTRV